MAQVKVKLLRPLNGEKVGSTKSYERADAARLAASGAVQILGKGEGRAPANKAEGAAPANKAARPAKNKAGARTRAKRR